MTKYENSFTLGNLLQVLVLLIAIVAGYVRIAERLTAVEVKLDYHIQQMGDKQ